VLRRFVAAYSSWSPHRSQPVAITPIRMARRNA
jgi:hypothetical protein